MDFTEVRDVLDRECNFPAEESAVLSCVGDRRLEGVLEDPVTVRTVLERTEGTTYRSAQAVFEALAATVGEDYVGRKGYDDRGGARTLPEDRSLESV